ncbi:ABC transporter substrate-binding protein [Streptomyces jeddahensis]|uniref:Multiple sugar-binding protein n=1 Tax=Streptomyces jeddahensis TaxID=1716141 RepID=A0A177HHW1_9ACTN|nr:extracellular solute-binding protein [Streptomyces jeddahensis]OAH10179.1 multiple sugar-binding protein precursor [Streptomyces jeddahensis]
MQLARIALSSAVAVTLSLLSTACSGGAEGDQADGPVVIDMWSWNEERTMKPIVDKFNATHDDIQLRLVKQVDLPGAAANLRNAVASGKDVPCLVQSVGEVPALTSEGLLTDVTDALQPYLDDGLFNEAALSGAKVGDRYYGVPSGFNPNFMIINRAVYDKYDIEVPTTWDELIAAGEKLRPHGVYVMNLAGEDPSTLVNLVQQAGGSWYEIEGDAWRVDFLSEQSRKAADIVQQLIDKDLVAHQTYLDRPALIDYFDSGRMVSLPTSTWQLTKYEIDFRHSTGDWQPIDLPQFSDAEEFVTQAHGGAELVPKGCQHVKEAVEVSVWKATNKDAINATLDPKTGAYAWPGAVPDPSPWVDSAVPERLFGERRGEARDVIMKAVESGRDPWVVGPNYTGVFAELQDQWAKAVKGEITMVELLERMQDFTVKDLRSKNIDVVGS